MNPNSHPMDRAISQPPSWRRYALWGGLTLLALLIVVTLRSCWSERTYRIPLDKVTLGEAIRGPFEDYIAVRSSAAPFITRYLTAEQGGSVQQVLVEDGASVTSGQSIVILTNTALQLQVAAREADAASQINALENTKIQLEETRFKYEQSLLDIEHQISKLTADLARDKILLDGKAIAPTIYQQEQEEYAYLLKLREATVASAAAESGVRASQLAQLQATLGRLKTSSSTFAASLAGLTIRAPMDGQLTALSAEVGQSKAQGEVLGQIDSLDRFKLTALVDEFYLGRIVVGQSAIYVFDGHDHKAQVTKIYPKIANGTFRIDLQLDAQKIQGVRAGQTFDIKLELGQAATATMLPNGPFYQETGGSWAFVVAPNGQYATRRQIRLGRRNPNFVEVVDGLAPGEKVIVSGYEAFKKVDRVTFEKPSNDIH
jgi:HlyD family secretion protein